MTKKWLFQSGIFACLYLSLFGINYSQAQGLVKGYPQTNGRIFTSALKNDTLFVGGNFTSIYNSDSIASFGTIINPYSGKPSASWDQPNGEVFASTPDKKGGFFIGGNFTKVGDKNSIRFAHLDSTGNNSSLMQGTHINGTVKAMASMGDTLLVGGQFSLVGNFTESSGAPVIKRTNLVNQNFPSINGEVWSAIPDGKGGWYIGGNFTNVGGVTRNNAARIDGNGNLLSWNPNTNGHVLAMQLYQNKVYLGGSFSQVNSLVRSGIAAVDTATGVVSTWAPGSPSTVIRAMEVSNNTLFVAGVFSSIASQVRANVASFSLPSETLTSFATTMTSLGASLYSLAVVGNKVFVGGLFTNIGGFSRTNLACLNAQTGFTVSAWQANTNDAVYAIVYFNDHVYVGGTFTNIKGLPRNYLAAADTLSGTLHSFSPSLNGAVQCMTKGTFDDYLYVSGNFTNFYTTFLLSNHMQESWPLKATYYANTLSMVGSRIFVGGSIASLGGANRTNLAAFSMQTGQLLEWSPTANARVEAICNVKDSFLYIGGYFSMVNGVNRDYFAILNRNGTLNNFVHFLNGHVRTIAYGGDSIVYVGGNFTNVSNLAPYISLVRSCSKITAINFRTGRVQPSWNPTANNDVYSLLVDGNTLYAGGIFTAIGGQPRQFIAAISRNTALAGSFDPGLFSASTSVNALCKVDSNLVIGGNFFYNVNGINIRRNLASFNIGNSVLSNFVNEPNLAVNCLTPYQNRIYCGGNFSLLGAMSRNNVAAFIASTGRILDFDLGTSTSSGSHSVSAMHWQDDFLFLGGTFSMIGELSRNKFGVIHVPTKTVHPFDPNPLSTGVIYSIYVHENLLFIGGQFTNISGTARNRVAIYNYPSFTLNAANPNFSGWPLSYATINSSKLLLGGLFTTIGGQTAANCAAFSMPAVSRIIGTPIYNSSVSMISRVNNQLYVAGGFTTIGGVSKPNFAILDTGTLIPTSFTSANSGGISCFAITPGGNAYMGGNFTLLGGSARSVVGSINVNTGLANTWAPILTNPAPNSPDVRSIQISQNKVIITGQFDKINQIPMRSIAVFYTLDTMVQVSNLSLSGNQCKGTNFQVNYTVNRNFGSTNQFTVELVDSALPNKRPIELNTITQQTSGSIQATLPLSLTPGRTYYVQIKSSNPAVVSALSTQVLKPIDCSPTIGSSNLIFSAITQNSATLSWTKGNGTNCIVIGRFGSAVNALPQNGRSYLGNAAFGLGDTIGGGNFVLYVGTANSVNISLLNQLSNYHFAVIEFNGNNTSADYLNSQTLYGNMNTLPVAWLSFNGDRLDASEIQLNWTTAQEINNNYFNVERKIGEQSEWITLAKVNGSGNSFSNRKYRYLDVLSEANKTDKHLFYRLKQVDFDGKYSYSKTIQLAIDLSETLMIIPNPFIQSFTVNQGLNKIIAYKIFNLTGELVQAENVNSTFLTIDGTTFKQGMYIIEVQTISSKIVRKIVKM
jgi:hypothetical protein